jgi:POT family proton-dependent oligopeptide transporter
MSALPSPAAPAAEKPKLPPQISFIIGNEACERFSFYGMRNILVPFLAGYLLLDMAEGERAAAAKEVFHVFVMGVYFFPLLGGWLADRVLGKYRVIFWLSLLYCVGHAMLATFEAHKPGFYAGLALISLGSGGIKPCVSAFVGDQFDEKNKALARVVFDAFYWIINFGSFFASLSMPWVLENLGPSAAFGIPGIFMGLATLVFWLGRKGYVVMPPKPADPHSFLRIVWTALTAGAGDAGRGGAATGEPRATPSGSGKSGLALLAVGVIAAGVSLAFWSKLGAASSLCLALVSVLLFGGVGAWMNLERARGHHPDEDVDGARSVLRILVLFALVTPFSSLFDQKASTWVIQAGDMTRPSWFKPAQMQALNPLLVMILIPFNNAVLYPALRRAGKDPTPLRKMTAGITFAGISWIVVGVFQLVIDGGARFSIVMQVLPYALLTFGEVLVSATGLEFAYSQAPLKMKGAIMAFWGLAVTVGNLWVLLANLIVRNDAVKQTIESSGALSVTAFLMFFFAVFAFIAAVAFGLVARRYPVADHYRRVQGS